LRQNPRDLKESVKFDIQTRSLRLLFLLLLLVNARGSRAETLRYHVLATNDVGQILPWYNPVENAFDNYLDKCWEWAVNAPLDYHGLPISFLYCAWSPGTPPTPSRSWENDVGEKIPNWVESARLYYQYTGNRTALDQVKQLVDYSLDHGQTPTNHVWPDFPVGTSNAGDTEFRGFTQVWDLWDCHVDLAADLGLAMYRMYQLYGESRYLDKAVHVADLLATRIVPGSATRSPWPYVVNSLTGSVKVSYAASWDGALQLFDLLIENGQGDTTTYGGARSTLKTWLLTYPMQNGNWVDGHSDVRYNGTENLSATCASDMCLYLFEHPDWDPDFLTDVPRLLAWAEDNFVDVPTVDGLAGQYHGAFVPAEQTAYMYRMGYQAARLGAQYALWYEVSGAATYRDRAYRCLAYNTYMMQSSGQSSDGPTDTVGHWWSDCYGEAPRMYYYAMGAVPEWAPPGENHLLRSSSVVTSILYTNDGISYTTFEASSTETFRLGFTPRSVRVNGSSLPQRSDLSYPGWVFTATNGVLRVRHATGNSIQISTNLSFAMLASNPAPATVGFPYSHQLEATGGAAPYTWSLQTNAPGVAGLTLSPDGVLSGVLFATGRFVLSLVVRDSLSEAATGDVEFTVDPVRIVLGVPRQTAGQIGSLGPTVTLWANAPGNYQLWRSSDLNTWTLAAEVTYTNGLMEVTDPLAAGADHLFYRALQPLRIVLGFPLQTAGQIAALGSRITLWANAPGNYQLWRSSDLTTWTLAAEVTYTSGLMEVTDAQAGNADHLFYRALQP